MLVKGPAYVADAYPLMGADRPGDKQADGSSPNHYAKWLSKPSEEKIKQ